ncbi:MAG: response regulator transcription factor [Terracidiphilus sp.]
MITVAFPTKNTDPRARSEGATSASCKTSSFFHSIFAPLLVYLSLVVCALVSNYSRQVREKGHQMPILMLTAKGQEEDIILGLNLGADDYIIKPFRRGELIARVKAFLRRTTSLELNVVRFGNFELNLTAHKLLCSGKEVELTAKEFRLLELFVTRPGRALTRDEILNSVWGSSVIVTMRSIDRCVATLRAKIETTPHSPIYIANHPRYRLSFHSRSGIVELI